MMKDAIPAMKLNRKFVIFAVGNASSLTGIWMQHIAVGWLVWTLSRSGVWLGVLAVAELVSRTALYPVAGLLIDRIPIRRILISAQVVILFQGLILFLLVTNDFVTMFGLTVVCFLQGFGSAFHEPAGNAMVRGLVSRAELSAAISFNSILKNSTLFTGPAVALVTVQGEDVTFLVSSSLVFSILFIMILARVPIAQMKRPARIGWFAGIRDGYVYAAQDPTLRTMLLALFGVSLGGRAIISLLPSYADRIVGSFNGLAILTGSFGLGSMAAGAWMLLRRARQLVFLVVAYAAVTAIAVAALALPGISFSIAALAAVA